MSFPGQQAARQQTGVAMVLEILTSIQYFEKYQYVNTIFITMGTQHHILDVVNSFVSWLEQSSSLVL